MTSRAHVEYDPRTLGVRAAITRGDASGRPLLILQWNPTAGRHLEEGYQPENEADWLRLQEDDARALYEALADYFGHGVADGRQARADLDHERRRVDKMLDAILPGVGR